MSRADEYAALAAAERLADLCTGVAGSASRSVVLHGSLAAGGFRPGRSDIDLLVVVDGGLTDAQSAALERGVVVSDAGNADGIDLQVVTTEVAVAPTLQPEVELHVGRYGGEIEVARRVADPDLLAELSMARAGRALRGAEPSEVIAPVPSEWVVDRGRHWLTTWRSLTDDTANAAFMVLTACRMWRFAVEGVHSSKTEAAAWALDRDPSLMVVRQARRQYLDDPTVVVDESGIAALLDVVLEDTARQR
jgi:predicted nucleotidyltransferase